MKPKFWLTNFRVVPGPPYTSWSKRAEESNRASAHLGDPCRWAQVVLWIPNWHREKEEFWKLVKPHDWRQTRRENDESIMVEISHLNRLLIGPWVIINSRWLSFYCDYGKAILYRWSKTLLSQEYFLSIYLHLGYWGIKGKKQLFERSINYMPHKEAIVSVLWNIKSKCLPSSHVPEINTAVFWGPSRSCFACEFIVLSSFSESPVFLWSIAL